MKFSRKYADPICQTNRGRGLRSVSLEGRLCVLLTLAVVRFPLRLLSVWNTLPESMTSVSYRGVSANVEDLSISAQLGRRTDTDSSDTRRF